VKVLLSIGHTRTTDVSDAQKHQPLTQVFKFVKRYFTQTTYLRGSNSY